VGTEREMKFTIEDPAEFSAEALSAAFADTDLTLEPRPTVRHADRYYDDPRFSLSRAGVALRRRIGRGKIVATFKTRGQIRGAMHEREEIELPMTGREWPEVIHDRVSRITDPAALKGRFELETDRLSFMVVGSENAEGEPLELAEISIDRVEATRPTGGRSVSFAELEIEDFGGGPELLQRIAERIGRFAPLRPGVETKLERARRLLMTEDLV
jgi:inorganic triphosphatase YgiF